MKIRTLTDISLLQETVELECKLASGQDGTGKLPKDLWETYSAFANTHGGIILLGIQEKPMGTFRPVGVENPQRLITDLFNTLNNSGKVSTNLLSEKDVETITLGGKAIIQIQVPAATRKQKPVFLNGNPIGNTYRRLHDGDRKCDDETVRRMLAECVEDERDSRILPGFTQGDIDPQTFKIYRQMFKDAKPGHPWLELDDFALLKRLRGWRQDRTTREEGLTLAGVLMFGTWDAIQEALPHYFVDYQERPEAKTELRWIDRVVPDGSWSGNVFDFYRIVYRKLTDPSGLKVPFRLSEGQRKDDTPVHEAIREALVNTLVHADYSGRLSVLVVKRPDMLGFRNPGDMRVTLEQAMSGGESDCRNRIMHQMFLMIGLGERAGSGIPKIYSGWDWRHWRSPSLYEKDDPSQTLLELRMLELLPDGVLEQLEQMFGERFTCLERLERLILATAATEQVVSHARMVSITTEHSHDITIALQSLVRQGLLQVNGQGRGAMYYLPGHSLPTPEQIFGNIVLSNQDSAYEGTVLSKYLESYSEHLPGYSEHLENYSEHLGSRSEDKYGRLVHPDLNAPIVHDLRKLSSELRLNLEKIADEPRTKGRIAKGKMRHVVLKLCQGHYVTRNCLAELVNRDPDALRQQYIKSLVEEHLLEQAFPQSPNDTRQAYIATGASKKDEQ